MAVEAVEAVEITDLEYANFAENHDGNDLLVIYDVSEPSNNTKKVKRDVLLHDVVFEDGDHNLGAVEITQLTTQDADIGFTSGSTLSYAIHGSVSPAPANIAAGASETVTATLTGATTAHQLVWNMTGALPDGLHCQAWISAANTVSFKFYNSTGATITGATYGAKVTALGFS